MNKILHFTKPAEYIRTTSGTIFSVYILISSSQVIFQYKPDCIPLEAFVSNNGLSEQMLYTILLLHSNGNKLFYCH